MKNETLSQRGYPNPIRLKATLLSDDGGHSWVVVRQFYVTDLRTNSFIDEKFEGIRLRTLTGIKGVLSAENPIKMGAQLLSNDGGRSWIQVRQDFITDLRLDMNLEKITLTGIRLETMDNHEQQTRNNPFNNR
jgi:hypothetical protein